MKKTEARLSQQDKELLQKGKKETRTNLIVWTLLAVIILSVSFFVYFVRTLFYDHEIIIIICMIILPIPAYAITRFYGFYKSINRALLVNKKLIIEAETNPHFLINKKKEAQFFKNDSDYYTFFRRDFNPFRDSCLNILSLPNSSEIHLEIVYPEFIVFNFEILPTSQNFTTEIVSLNATEKKEIIDNIKYLALLINFMFLPILAVFLGIIFGFISQWKLNDTIMYPAIILILFFIISNLYFFVNYFLTCKNLKNPNKIILTGKVTDTLFLFRAKNRSRTFIYLGYERIEVTNEYFKNGFLMIGDKVKIHYFQKANKEKGNLIRVEKIE